MGGSCFTMSVRWNDSRYSSLPQRSQTHRKVSSSCGRRRRSSTRPPGLGGLCGERGLGAGGRKISPARAASPATLCLAAGAWRKPRASDRAARGRRGGRGGARYALSARNRGGGGGQGAGREGGGGGGGAPPPSEGGGGAGPDGGGAPGPQ